MTRETRANLIFLGLFLAVSLPGAVILVKKKMQPGAAPMGMPDFVRRRVPYMVPLATPDDQVLRVVPPQTGAGVGELIRRRAAGAAEPRHGPLPVTSSDRVVQVTGLKEEGGRTLLYLLAWEGGYGTEAARYRVVATAGAAGERFDGRVVTAEPIPVPEAVKKELMSGGYVKPPAQVTWIEVAFDAPVAATRPLSVRLAYETGGEPAATAVDIFAK
jgi:hypothetical protein